MTKRSRDLTTGNIAPMLARLTWPMIFGMLGMVVFNLADTYFIGKVGVDELAAIGFAFPVVMLVGSLGIGMGIGTSSLISRMIVTEDRLEVRRYATEAIILALGIIILFVTAGHLTIYPLFRAMGASEKLLPLIYNYMHIWYWGMIFVMVPMVGNNIIRSTGDTFTPGMIMLVSAIINIIMDPILIFGWGPIPAMSLKGAALATVFGRATGMMVTFYILIRREKLLTLSIPGIEHVLNTWKKIAYVAGPATLAILISPLSIGIITRIISKFGEEAVAAFGVVSRIEMFALMVVHALGSVMIIFAGQNWAAGKIVRLNKGYKLSAGFSFGYGVMVLMVFGTLAQPVASIFSDNANVIGIAAAYMKIVAFSYGFHGIMMSSVSILNGINKPFRATAITFTRMLVLYVPLAWITSDIYGIKGVFWSAFTANITVGILAFIWISTIICKKQKVLEPKAEFSGI